jgi:histone acetyltransferase (RNA polymerase elongator complex component)
METAKRPLIIPVFIPHFGCPHQCAFCNQRSITSSKDNTLSLQSLRTRIDNFLEFKGNNRETVQIAFFGGNFLGQTKDNIRAFLFEAKKFVTSGKVDSIRFSTRPDTIDHDRLAVIKDFPVSTIELGVQSMDDRVLELAKRGHNSLHTQEAVLLLKEHGYEIGLQMMVGLPGESQIGAYTTGEKIAALSPDFVRIYPTVVLRGSPLANDYKNKKYSPIPLDVCVSTVKELFLLFKKRGIPVIRMGLQASNDLDQGSEILAGPYHPSFGHLVFSEIFLDNAASLLESNGSLKGSVTDNIIIKVHPRSISKMRGLKNQNISKLKKKFNIKRITIAADENIGQDSVVIDG